MTVADIIRIILKQPLVLVKKKRKKRRKKKQEVIPTRGQQIRENYINILRAQIAHLEQRLGNYIIKNENTKMMKNEIRRLKKNLKQEIQKVDDGIPVAFKTRQPSIRMRG
jgi:hypothetical protein